MPIVLTTTASLPFFQQTKLPHTGFVGKIGLRRAWQEEVEKRTGDEILWTHVRISPSPSQRLAESSPMRARAMTRGGRSGGAFGWHPVLASMSEKWCHPQRIGTLLLQTRTLLAQSAGCQRRPTTRGHRDRRLPNHRSTVRAHKSHNRNQNRHCPRWHKPN